MVEVVHRCHQIEGVDEVVLAIPDTAENDILEKWVSPWKPRIIRGPEHDVLARYVKAAEAVNADVIMRVTADCPLLDPGTCSAVLSLQKETGADYVSNSWPTRSYPHGWDCEVFTRELLVRADKWAGHGDPSDRQHVCPWMQKIGDVKLAHLKATEDRSHLRWTLDTLADYVVIWNLMQEQMH